MELKDGDKIIDKSSYKFYQDNDKYFVQLGEMSYLKQDGMHISLDEYSKEFLIAKAVNAQNQQQLIGNFELLDISSVSLWKVNKKHDLWYIYIPSESKSKAPAAEIYFNVDLKPTLIKLPFPETVLDDEEEVKADVFLKFEYNSNFVIPDIDDWFVETKGKYVGKGKYKSYEINYIND